MDTINIQLQVPNTGQYTLDEFVAKVKDYANKLVNNIIKAGSDIPRNIYESQGARSVCSRKSQSCP